MTAWFRAAWEALGDSGERNAVTIMAKLAEMLNAHPCPPMVRVVSEGIFYVKHGGGKDEEHLYRYNSVKRWVSYEHDRHSKRGMGM